MRGTGRLSDELTKSHRLDLACAYVCEASCWLIDEEKSRNRKVPGGDRGMLKASERCIYLTK